MVAFPEEPNRKISLHVVIKERLLYFNAISSEELMIYLQEKEPQVKIL